VPFAELLPFRGYARKIFDGAETRRPTLHGVVVRKDFGEQYPEIVVGYIKALIEANDWFRKDPKTAAEKVGAWTGIDKEVVYMFLGPGGVHTLDPTIKPEWVKALTANYEVLKKQNMLEQLNLQSWVNDRYVRLAYAELGLDYERELTNFSGYPIEGQDPVCHVRVDDAARAGQIWIADGPIEHFSSPACTLNGIKQYTREGKKIGAAYVVDRELGIQLFADKAFYALGGSDAAQPEIVPFLLKRAAEEYASKNHARVASYAEALSALPDATR
jgi:NitT/TauT family transport system substrate-binding protein